MNIHPLLKNWVPFSQGRCSSAAGSGKSACLMGQLGERQGTRFWPGRRRFAAQSSLLLQPPLPLSYTLCSHSVREAEKPLSAAAKNCVIGVVLVGKKFLWAMQTALHSSFHRSCGPTLGHYLKSLLWPNVSITFTLLVAEQIGSQL